MDSIDDDATLARVFPMTVESSDGLKATIEVHHQLSVSPLRKWRIEVAFVVAQVSLADSVLDIKEQVGSLPELCHITNFALELDGVRLADVAPLAMYSAQAHPDAVLRIVYCTRVDQDRRVFYSLSIAWHVVICTHTCSTL